MPILLHAVVDFYNEPYEDTCLCDVHYTDYNKNWVELNYGPDAKWREFEADTVNTDYAELTCTICGFPIGSEKEPPE